MDDGTGQKVPAQTHPHMCYPLGEWCRVSKGPRLPRHRVPECHPFLKEVGCQIQGLAALTPGSPLGLPTPDRQFPAEKPPEARPQVWGRSHLPSPLLEADKEIARQSAPGLGPTGPGLTTVTVQLLHAGGLLCCTAHTEPSKGSWGFLSHGVAPGTVAPHGTGPVPGSGVLLRLGRTRLSPWDDFWQGPGSSRTPREMLRRSSQAEGPHPPPQRLRSLSTHKVSFSSLRDSGSHCCTWRVLTDD